MWNGVPEEWVLSWLFEFSFVKAAESHGWLKTFDRLYGRLPVKKGCEKRRQKVAGDVWRSTAVRKDYP